MYPYQEKYIENILEIKKLKDVSLHISEGFDSWYEKQLQAAKKMAELKKENIAILNSELFPVLDDLYAANDETLGSLETFADRLLDWSTNLDPGVYIAIHDALLRMYRVRKDRDRIIKELYKLGMGLYYLNRMIQGSDHPLAKEIFFENEMVFTEGASYLRYFDRIENEETKGYIIRCLANISIATTDRKRRISTTAKVLNIISDPYYRELAPSLPWDTFLQRTYQQMSSNRSTLSKGDLSNEELSLVMEACQIVFEPEKENDNPNVRWLWPYYEMEYSCGFTDLKTTLQRMEELITSTEYDQYDISGLYANVQLPIYYGRLLKENEELLAKPRYLSFLKEANQKMMRSLLSFPNEKIDDFYFYDITLLTYMYLETEGVDSYLDVTTRLMGRLTGNEYIRLKCNGQIIKLLCTKIFENDPQFFDDIDFLKEISDPETKKEKLLSFAEECGIYYDFGSTCMNLSKISCIRDLSDREYEIFKLHTTIGYETLKERGSTRSFADIALGHHAFYDESDGYPDDYVRISSPFRRMTDIVSVVSYISERYDGNISRIIQDIINKARTQFSPIVASYLEDEDMKDQIEEILTGERKEFYKELYSMITNSGSDR